MPGQLDILDSSFDSTRIFQSTAALVYVIDCQAEYMGSLQNLDVIIRMALAVNPDINIEVLIHKIDGLSEGFRMDTLRDIDLRVSDLLSENGIDPNKVVYFMTSIYDRSIQDAFSSIVQRLLPEAHTLENMLNSLCQQSGIETAFLFDSLSKIYVAKDSASSDPQVTEICGDFIDVSLDLESLYSGAGPAANTNNANERRPLKSISRMQSGIVLYMCQMIRGLVLVGFIREESTQKMALIDYNVEIFTQGLQRMWPQYSNIIYR